MEEGDLGVRHGASHHHKVKDRLVSLKRPAILTCQGDIKKEFFFQIFICNSHNTHLKEYRSTENYYYNSYSIMAIFLQYAFSSTDGVAADVGVGQGPGAEDVDGEQE